MPSSLHRWFPFLAWPRPTRHLLHGELWAGLTVGLMVIPQGVAYAALAGMPLVTGIYASMLPALVAVLWSSSTRLSVGPTALTCLLVASSLTGLAEPGSPQWINLAVWLALLSGLLQVGLGFMRFGWLLNVVSSPVLTGFTQAAAVLILASQLPALLGFRHDWAGMLAQPEVNLAAAAFGLGSLAALVLARRWSPRFPAVVLVVGLSAGLSAGLGFEASGGKVVGALAAGLPSFYVPSLLPWQALGELMVPALVITLVSFLETASSAKVDSQRGGHRWDQDQDLIGQGLAKITSAFSGAFPTSSSFSRSALNLFAGAQTGWATLVSVVVVLLALLLLTPVLHYVPQSVLAAVVVAAIYGTLKPAAFARLWRVSRVEAATGSVTFAVTVLSAPRLYWGVITGLMMGLLHFLYQRLHPRIIEVGLHPDGSLRDRHLWHLPPLAPGLYALRMDAELDFASATSLERAISDQVAAQPAVRHVCLFAQPINRIDATGVEIFGQIRQVLAARGITLHISGIKLPVETVLRRAGELSEGPLLRLYRTDAETMAALQQTAET
ncbi:SulP family inorganic anion transporter [Variovorax terrae]|uniref:SulP family inorganic anion transporter n=1 Tax=Variovorax terrae TaxID=2923278 RepID=A0A9X2AP77_9BURK|nr:SulP family inorganic anion transporter [Variovorax terrae]MCJ0765109.1 SulP family inorganic anion transporter [Variovorax terrae]